MLKCSIKLAENKKSNIFVKQHYYKKYYLLLFWLQPIANLILQ